jgi:hypothetical protein
MVEVMISRNLIQAKQIATSIIKEKRSNSRTSRNVAKAHFSDECETNREKSEILMTPYN